MCMAKFRVLNSQIVWIIVKQIKKQNQHVNQADA